MEENERFLFVAGRLCLDFVNTEVLQAGQRVSLLSTGEDLLAWLGSAKLPPSALSAALKEGLILRGALRSLAEALSQGQVAPHGTVAVINDVLQRSPGFSRIEPVAGEPGRYAEQTIASVTEPVHLLAPIARDAAALLCHGDPSLVRQCENPQCILFFYDTTKNHGRRWCRMTACGNRAKAAAHYRRVKDRAPHA